MNTASTRPSRTRASWIGMVLALVALYGLAVGLRRHVVSAQAPSPGIVLPFTLESALQYRLVQKEFTGEGIPRHDPDLQYPEGVHTFALDTTGAEAWIGRMARVFPRSLTLAERVRWIHVLWFCLGIPLMTLWMRTETRSWLGGLSAGLLYATAVSSVVRSTGQELSHENHALPLLLAHLWLDACAASQAARGKRKHPLGLSLLSGCFLGLAVATWDLIQAYTICWSLVRFIAWLRRPAGWSAARTRRDAAVWCMLAAAGAASPYLRSHGFLLSPTMLFGYGIFLGATLVSLRTPAGAAPSRRLGWVVLVPWLLALPLASSYLSSYGHFAELFWAKLRFLNQKPADPSLLTFSQRILWTPALHSATVPIVRFLFPAFLWLTGTAFVVFFIRLALSARPDFRNERAVRVGFLFLVSVAAFVLFVRFHVFVALFGSALVGFVAGVLDKEKNNPQRKRIAVGLLLALCSGVEMFSLVNNPERAGRPRVYYDQLNELAVWLKHKADRQPVLANFGVSATVLTYGGCPVLLHPKFEAPDIRERVQTFGRLLFGSGEEPLRAWAEANGARYLVYAMGQFSSNSPEYQMRYMVQALHPPRDAPARKFEFNPHAVEHFRFLWGNAKYRIFRIHRKDDQEEWLFRRGAAQDALAEARLDEAERHAEQALQIQPEDAETWRIIRRVLSLRRAGFTGEANP